MSTQIEPTSMELRLERFGVGVAFFSLGLIFASYAGRLAEFKAFLCLSEGNLGISLFCFAIGSLVAMPIGTIIASRYGSARATIYASSAFCCALLLLPLASTWLAFSGALLLFGVALGSQDVSMNAHAVEVERKYGRTIMSSFHGLFSVGAMTGAILCSGANSLGLSLSSHYACVCAAMLSVLLLSARFIRSPNTLPPNTQLFVLPDRRIMILSIVAFCSFIGEGAVGDWSAVYLAQELHASTTMASAGLAAFCLTMAVCRLLADPIVCRLGTKKILIASGLIATAGQSVALLVRQPAAAICAYLFVGIGFACMVPVAFSAAGQNKDVPAATAIAGVATLGYAGFVVAPPLIGLMADHYGLSSSLWLAVALSACVSLLSPAIKES